MRCLRAFAAVLLIALAFSPPAAAFADSAQQLAERPALLTPLWQLLAPLRALLRLDAPAREASPVRATTAAARGGEEEPPPVSPLSRGTMDPDG